MESSRSEMPNSSSQRPFHSPFHPPLEWLNSIVIPSITEDKQQNFPHFYVDYFDYV